MAVGLLGSGPSFRPGVSFRTRTRASYLTDWRRDLVFDGFGSSEEAEGASTGQKDGGGGNVPQG